MPYFPRKTQQIAIAFCLSLIFSILVNAGITNQLLPVLGQTVRPEMVAEQVYQSLPDFPLENEYISQASGNVASQNTLILRILRYHEYVKSRPLRYRFDWQLTFADYFDINEPMSADRYPGHRTLTVNPLESDRDILTNLTRTQRNQLIDTLLAIYNPQPETTPEQPTTPPNNSSEERNQKPSLPQPGDADLLLPVE
ncbi:conserved hypothetical protein [Hyella patelloides LEGE 07179]|uniref:Uncharacterized protein n=1 Tax=Hyella patelloides LEGE 07179 TaxID=945734 RepID=A0A563VQR0_9CYAN|nr:hypothetical protein [Hyella patelloides]VEP13719.1 conserved hypothetical protein [Hyella patelloides LEGE 07179]